jgi:manganese/iron transport system ATP-binding protein
MQRDPVGGIFVRDVTVAYRNGATALHNVSFEISRGTITALVGVNGAGKSTLFRAIMGFVRRRRMKFAYLGKRLRKHYART